MTNCCDIIAKSEAGFGTSGVRGLVEELNDETCIAYVTAFLDHLQSADQIKPGTTIWVGKDLRPSSKAIASACIKAIETAGHKAIYCGEVPTPALAYSAINDNAPAIMVTGSHIPFDRNGIKFYRPDGEISKDDEQPIITSKAKFPNLKGGEAPDLTQDTNAHDAWMQRYVTAFDGLLKSMRIGHYQHSAAGRDLLAELLTTLGATVVPLGRSEIFVPIDTEAVSDADNQQAKQWANQHQLDAIISTDGDGDRPLLSDENGSYFRGDTLGILAAIALQAEAVITPVSSNTALEKSDQFQQVIRTKIGSPHVIKAMQDAADTEQTRVVGFEANGGFLTASNLLSPWNQAEISPLATRDSILPVLSTITLSKLRKLPLSNLTSLLPARFTVSDRLENTPKERSLDLIEQVKSDSSLAAGLHIGGLQPMDTNDVDGHRITFSNQDIVHFRPSGNAPEMRIYVESDSQSAAAELLKFVKTKVSSLLST